MAKRTSLDEKRGMEKTGYAAWFLGTVLLAVAALAGTLWKEPDLREDPET